MIEWCPIIRIYAEGEYVRLVMTLAHGGGDFYDSWMKNPKSAMIECNDRFRPVSFYIEVLDEEACLDRMLNAQQILEQKSRSGGETYHFLLVAQK